MFLNIGLISYLTASLGYTVLALMLWVSWRGRPFGGVLIAASALSAIWAGVVAAGTLLEYPPVKAMQLAEVLRNAGWLFFLLQLTSLRFDGETNILRGWKWVPLFSAALAAVLALIFLRTLTATYIPIREELYDDINYATWLGLAIFGLLLLEQIFRNSSAGEQWSIKYLCLGLGGVFGYDFFMYAEAVLFRQLSPHLWQARGLVNALVIPLLAISIARNTDWKLHLHVSRQVVFHTVTLLGTGFYLLMMAMAGYFIKFMGGNWSSLLQIAFLVAAGALLVVLLFSGRIRAHVRVLLSKHFFTYKYDYREQWQNFTRTLADTSENTPDSIVRAMALLVSSSSGLLWGRSDKNQFALLSHWQMPELNIQPKIEELAGWLEHSEWVIDIDELQSEPDIYKNLNVPVWLEDIPNSWLIIPLMLGDTLQGVLLLKRSDIQKTINWEDRDLLKTAGRQAASQLAQYLANNALVEARQFDAFNRLSAYVVHDLKNILAQQSLIVSNAQKHKNNPDFVDDMISTVNNSVARMTKLMEQMRSGLRGSEASSIDLATLLEEVVKARSEHYPQVDIIVEPGETLIRSSRDQLYTVFNHLVQNAQEATEKSGAVNVRLRRENNMAIIEIKDNGCGMTDDFIKNRLFKPFDSTKGLTGMGIGAFESRDFIRSLGGDIQVESHPGRGSLFVVHLPCMQEE